MSGHGDDHGHGGDHGGHDDPHVKIENDSKTSSGLEKSIEDTLHDFEKDIKTFKEKHTKKNFQEIEKLAGYAHFETYKTFKEDFEKLATHGDEKGDKLAEAGKSLSDKHINDLLESYVTNFFINSNKHNENALNNAKIHVQNYKNTKFDDEHARLSKLKELAEIAGISDDNDDETNIFGALYQRLKTNDYRDASVVNDLAGGVKQRLLKHHKKLIWDSTLGKKTYKNSGDSHKLALKALNDIGEGLVEYDIDHDEHHKSSFYGKNVGHFKSILESMAHDKKYTADNDSLKKNYGLKIKGHGDSHGDGDHGHDAHH